MGDDATRELPRITVPAEVDAGIRRLAKEGGQTITWHRRRAYAEYVERAQQRERLSGPMSSHLTPREPQS